MDKQSEAQLKILLAKDMNDLTEYDKGFLRARRSYIGKNSRIRLAEVLDETPAPKEEPKEQTISEKLDEAIENNEHPAVIEEIQREVDEEAQATVDEEETEENV